jgi:uncharacterized protein (DUF58 family)
MRSSVVWWNVLADLPLEPVGRPHGDRGQASDPVRARRAEVLSNRLPPLLVAAQRVATTVAQGVHGRRRVGQGDSFWQFRPYVSGDPVNRIDWRQSARSGREAPDGWLVRQTEWDAAQTVFLWRDGSASMDWRSRSVTANKKDRASLLLLALASLLLRGGERVAAIYPGARPVSGRFGLDRVLAELDEADRVAPEADGVPPDHLFPRFAHVVLIGDFLSPLARIQETIGRMSAVPVTGTLLQVLDPAETNLPYDGRIRFQGLEGERDALIPRVESIRGLYRGRLRAQQDGLAALCAAAGFGFGIHRTDHPPETALLALYNALGAR